MKKGLIIGTIVAVLAGASALVAYHVKKDQEYEQWEIKREHVRCTYLAQAEPHYQRGCRVFQYWRKQTWRAFERPTLQFFIEGGQQASYQKKVV